MARTIDWEIPTELQPKSEDVGVDRDETLTGILGLQATIPEDAFTATTLGTERAGSGVLIRKDGLVLTIGYLITEADSIWLTSGVGGAVPATVLGYDQETGFGLVQALGRLNVRPVELGTGPRVGAGDNVVIAAEGGRRRAIAADMLTYGRPNRPPRPWLGLYAAEVEDENAVVVAGMSERGPASKSGLKPGDRILAVRDDPVSSLASFWRRVWASGQAGCEVVLQVQRDEERITGRVPSSDRPRLLKAPRLH